MARIAIVGPGAIGGVIAAWLGRSGKNEVFLCARRPLAELVVTTPDGVIESRPQVFTEPSAAPRAEWVLVCTKAYDAAGAAAWFPSLVGPETTVAILQNGIEHRECFAPYLAADAILPVVVDIPSERSTPTHIQHRGAAKMVVPDSAPGRAFAALFHGIPVEVTLTADFLTAAWKKLCLNNAGVINALLLQPTGVMHDEKLGDLARGLVRECIAVGRAEGAHLDDTLPDSVVEGMRRAPADGVNSLHADHAAGRPMEIDARNGVVVRLGRRHGIPTPFNQMAVALLEAMGRTAAAR